MLAEILKEALVKTDVNVNSWQEALICCGKLLQEQHKIEEAYIHSMMKTVEELGPYMILLPDIAFFHGVPGSDVKEVCLSLITLAQPVYFKEFKGQSIRAAFAFGAVDRDSHMLLLSQLALLLQEEGFIERLKNGGSKAELLDIIKHY